MSEPFDTGAVIDKKPVMLTIAFGVSTFSVEVGEGNEVESSDLAGLHAQVKAWTTKQKSSKRKKLSIPVLKWGWKNFSVLDAVVTGIHAGTGSPIVKVGDAAASQVPLYQQHDAYLRPMAPDERAKLVELRKASITAEKDFVDYKERFDIRLSEYVKKKMKEEE